MEQTAVEWLENEITNRITRRNPHDSIIIQTQGETLIELLEQAKEMEKQQIEDAFEKGFITTQWDKTKENKAEQYYIKTFKQP
jgi:predicted RNase H-like HicB family nuclease